MRMNKSLVCILVTGSFLLLGCNPTVRVEVPDEPITINMNIKIEHEVRIKVDKELDDIFADDSGLF